MCPELSWWTRGLWRGPGSEQFLGPHHSSGGNLHPGDAAGLTFKFKSDPLSKSPGNSIRLPGYIKGKANLYLQCCWTSSEKTSLHQCTKLSLYALRLFQKKSLNFSLHQCTCFLLWVNFSPVNSHEELWRVEFSLSLDFENGFSDQFSACDPTGGGKRDGN